MQRIFVIADTHFGHKRIIEFEAEHRPFKSIEEHDRSLIERWNAVVGKKDTVWHLGDVFVGKDGHLPLRELNGIKKLVLGNHDHYPIEVYREYFTKVLGAAEYGHCLLTHVPVHPCQVERRYVLNVHGHTHSKTTVTDRRYVCVSAERVGLQPYPMSRIMAHAAAVSLERVIDER